MIKPIASSSLRAKQSLQLARANASRVIMDDPSTPAASTTYSGKYSGRRMSLLAPTPPDRLVDAKGRPYFLWDEDLTIDMFRARLADPDPEVRAYYLGKLMRQAKPDDVFTFVTLADIKALFPLAVRYLGRSREFWTWLLGCWKALPGATE